MNIRRLSANERHYVVDLFDKYRIFYKQPTDKELADRFIKERLENNESIIFVAFAEQNGQAIPVGFTQLYPKYSSVRAAKNWILNDLFVEANYRRKGIDEKLIQTAIKFAKEKDAKFLQLETAKDNYTAQSLYESIGFKKQELDRDLLLYRIEVNL